MSAPLQHVSLLCLCTWYLLYHFWKGHSPYLTDQHLTASRTFLLTGKLMMLAIDCICFEPSQIITRQATPVTSSNWMSAAKLNTISSVIKQWFYVSTSTTSWIMSIDYTCWCDLLMTMQLPDWEMLWWNHLWDGNQLKCPLIGFCGN